METFHIQFQWPLSTVKTMMDKINVRGLGDINPTTSMYSSWANKADWQEFTSSIASQMITKSSDEAIQAVDNRLTSAELKLNELLVSSESSEVKLAGVKSLIADIEEIQGLICTPDSIENYPFFARWFTLTMMVMTVYNQYESRIAQVRTIKLWYVAKDYIQSIMHIATAERKNQIALAVADDDLFYIKDYGNQTALSAGVNFQSQGMKDLMIVLDIIATEKAQQNLNDLKFNEVVSLLRIGRNAIAVTGESKTSQENVADPTIFWDEYTKTITNQLTQDRAKVQNSFTQLAYSVPQELPSISFPEYTKAADDKPGKVDVDKLTNEILNSIGGYIKDPSTIDPLSIAQTVFSIGLGAIPGVGGVLSGITNLFFTFLGTLKEKPEDPWIKFEKELLFKVSDMLGESEAREIKNNLIIIDQYLSKYTKRMSKAYTKDLKQSDIDELHGDLSNMITNQIANLRQRFINPTSKSHHHVAPYYLHFFQSSLLTLSAAQKLGRNISEEKAWLYNDALKYIPLAIAGIVNQRKAEINKDSKSECGNTITFIKDRRLGQISGDYKSYSTNKSAYDCLISGTQYAAGTIAAVQSLKETTRVVVDNLKKDAPTIAQRIESAYSTDQNISIWHWQGQAWSFANWVKGLHYLVPDTGVVSYMDNKQLYTLDEKVKLPKTVFDLV